jgi:hypothetical protein
MRIQPVTVLWATYSHVYAYRGAVATEKVGAMETPIGASIDLPFPLIVTEFAEFDIFLIAKLSPREGPVGAHIVKAPPEGLNRTRSPRRAIQLPTAGVVARMARFAWP